MNSKSQNQSKDSCLPQMKCQGDKNCTQMITPQCNAGVKGVRNGAIICATCKAWRMQVATNFVLPLEKEMTIKCQKKYCNNIIAINCGAGALLANCGEAFCTQCNCFWGCKIVS
jgi:hypothetical protein